MKKHTWTIAFTSCLLAFTVFLGMDTFVLSSVYQTDATGMNTEMFSQAEVIVNKGEEEQKDQEAEEDQKDQAVKEDQENQKAEEAEEDEDSVSGASPRREKPTGSSKHGSGRASKSTNSFDEEEAAAEAALVTTDNAGSSETYEDENVKITYTRYTTNGTTIHVADVQLSSAEYLKTAFAEDTYGKNVTEATSAIAEAHDAILAINGDYYGVQEKGYVIRNGIVYRDQAGESQVLCIYADGSMKIVDPSTVTAQELVDQGVWQAFSFGPGLVENGEISVSLDSEVGRAKASNPRTAIGIIDDLHYVFVVSDGRTDDSEGLSLYELASFMDQLGVQTAYNLDGGGSSTMVFQNQIINNPTGGFGDREREVSDIVYIG